MRVGLLDVMRRNSREALQSVNQSHLVSATFYFKPSRLDNTNKQLGYGRDRARRRHYAVLASRSFKVTDVTASTNRKP